MLLLLLGLAVATVALIGLCGNKAPCRNPSSSVKRVEAPNANNSPQKLPDSLPSVTPPIASNVDRSQERAKTGPAQIANSPGAERAPNASPAGSVNNTGTGTTGGDATTTPQSSVKKQKALADHSARGANESICPTESNDLMIQTLTSGPDSLMERGQTTKTRADSMCQFPSWKKDVKGKKAGRGKRITTVETTAKTMQSPGKKTQIDKTQKVLKKELPSSSGNGEEEFTGLDPTSDRPAVKKEKAKDSKTKEEKRSNETKVATKASTALTITPVDSTQLSHTRKAPHK